MEIKEPSPLAVKSTTEKEIEEEIIDLTENEQGAWSVPNSPESRKKDIAYDVQELKGFDSEIVAMHKDLHQLLQEMIQNPESSKLEGYITTVSTQQKSLSDRIASFQNKINRKP